MKKNIYLLWACLLLYSPAVYAAGYTTYVPGKKRGDCAEHNLSNFSLPAKGGTYYDPAFGTKIERFTDWVNDYQSLLDGAPIIQYSTFTCGNADNTKVFFKTQAGPQYAVFYNTNGTFLRARSFYPWMHGTSTDPELRWSYSDPNRIFLRSVATSECCTFIIYEYDEDDYTDAALNINPAAITEIDLKTIAENGLKVGETVKAIATNDKGEQSWNPADKYWMFRVRTNEDVHADQARLILMIEFNSSTKAVDDYWILDLEDLYTDEGIWAQGLTEHESVYGNQTPGNWTLYDTDVYWMTRYNYPHRLWINSGAGFVEYSESLTDEDGVNATYRWYYDDANNKLYVYSSGDTPAANYTDIDALGTYSRWTSVAPDGSYGNVMLQQGPTGDANSHAIVVRGSGHDLDFSHWMHTSSSLDHPAWGYDKDNDLYYVHQNIGDYEFPMHLYSVAYPSNSYEQMDVQDDCDLYSGTPSMGDTGCHSSSSPGAPGWAFGSAYTDDNTRFSDIYDGYIWATRIIWAYRVAKSKNDVIFWRVAHTYVDSDNGGYNDQARTQLSQDAKYIYWASNWLYTHSNTRDIMRAILPSNWQMELEERNAVSGSSFQ